MQKTIRYPSQYNNQTPVIVQQDYSSMTMANLVDLLAQNTQKYTQYLTDNKLGEEYEQCKLLIQQLQKEIESRKQTNISDMNIHFDEPDSTA